MKTICLVGCARFQFFTRAPGAVEWRLIAANNWELGRCVSPFADLESCFAAVNELLGSVDAATEEVFRDQSGAWRWRLTVGRRPVAVACRAYSRKVECEGTLAQFRKAAVDATVVPHLRTFR